MFCTTLRKQPEWAPIIPSLLASTSPKFQERTLSTHDIAYPLPHAQFSTTTTTKTNKTNTTHPTYLHFLLLTPTSLHETNRPTTLARIDRLSTLTGNTKDVGIIFLLSDQDAQKPPTSAPTSSVQGTHAFMELQLLIHSHPTPISLPLLPLPSPLSLLLTLTTYAINLSPQSPSQPTQQPQPLSPLTPPNRH